MCKEHKSPLSLGAMGSSIFSMNLLMVEVTLSTYCRGFVGWFLLKFRAYKYVLVS